MKHSDARFLKPIDQQELRYEAVSLFLKGANPTDISNQLGVSRQSVYNWMERYSKSGKSGLKMHKRGRPKGKGTLLLPWQSAQIVKLIMKNRPDELSLPFAYWTREAVKALLEKKFDIKLSKWTAGRYLAKWGLSPEIIMKNAAK